MESKHSVEGRRRIIRCLRPVWVQVSSSLAWAKVSRCLKERITGWRDGSAV